MQWGGAHSSYLHGLGPNIRAAMSVYNDMIGLENFMQKVTCISQRLLACQPNKAACQLVSPTISLPLPESMRLDSIRLTRAKRALRIAAVLCLYCAAADHFIQNCPVRPPRPAMSTLQLEPDISTLSLLSVQLLTPDHSVANLCPCRLWFLGQFYIIRPPKPSSPAPKTPCLGAQSRNHSGKSVWAWVSKIHCSPFETVWGACMKRPSPFWYWRDLLCISSWDTLA